MVLLIMIITIITVVVVIIMIIIIIIIILKLKNEIDRQDMFHPMSRLCREREKTVSHI